MGVFLYGSAFESELRRIIAEKREEMRENLERGLSVKTIEDYRRAAGYLEALRDVGEWCSEVSAKLEKDRT